MLFFYFIRERINYSLFGKRKLKSKGSEEKSIEQFRAVIDNSTTLSMYNEKRRAVCIVRKNLAKDYDIEVDASEAPGRCI